MMTKQPTPLIAALVLAAGRSTRMGAHNKLLSPVQGRPMVAYPVEAAAASNATGLFVVTGHEGASVREAISGTVAEFVDNPEFHAGLSTSVVAGTRAVARERYDGVVILLGDMPWVTASHINSLIDAFDPMAGRGICVPTYGTRRGNPVLWGRDLFPELIGLSGDQGGRDLLRVHADMVHEVQMDAIDEGRGVLRDIDTPEDLKALQRAP